MKIIERRLRKLEGEFGPTNGKPERSSVLVVCNLAQELALDSNTCVEILWASGFLSNGALCLVDLNDIPDGLNAAGIEMFLRENGAQICRQ